MPIIRRAQINKFKEVLISESAGLIQDSLGGYTLDDPSLNPNGTGDFLGVIKTAVLLGRVEIHTVDTRNLSIAQFNNLTQQEFDNYVRTGIIRYNQPTGTPEVLGWVEMGRTNASFYYETCPGGKRPVSEHYYDMAAFAFDNKLVYGEGLELIPSSATAIGGPNTPLTPIGNFDPNWYTNMGPIAPRFEPLTLPQYMSFVWFNNGLVVNSNGEGRGISSGYYTSQTKPLRKNILFANRNDHFDNRFTVEITPGKWGAVRGVIEQSIVANVVGVQNPSTGVTVNMDFGLSKGECFQIITVTPSGGTTTTVTTGGPTPPVMVGGGGITTTPVTGGPISLDDEIYINTDFTLDSPRWDNLKIVGVPENKKYENALPPPDTIPSYTSGVQNRVLYQTKGTLDGWRDPRELVNDNMEVPPGNIHGFFNSKTNAFLVKPAILIETIFSSIKQKVGSVRASLSDNYRRNALKMYTLYTGSYIVDTYKYTQNKDAASSLIYSPYKYTTNKKLFESNQIMYSVGNDQLGNQKLTDSNSFRERCIFTGYNKTFLNEFSIDTSGMETGTETEKKFWANTLESTKKQQLNGIEEKNISQYITIKESGKPDQIKPRVFAVTYKSKSGKYFMSGKSPDSIFLGYCESYALHTESGKEDPRFSTNLAPSTGYKQINSKEFSSDRLYAPNNLRTGIYNDPGQFRELLTKNTFKNDIILKNAEIKTDPTYIQKNISTPILARRSELYGPNPFQHILYSDFIGWKRFQTNYSVPNAYAYSYGGLGRKCADTANKYGFRIVPIDARFEYPTFVESSDRSGVFWIEIVDKTRIIDVYFGLMEMHIKGYSWVEIFEVMDKLPKTTEYDTIQDAVLAVCNTGESKFYNNGKTEFKKISDSYDLIWQFMVSKKYV